jgi:hypothetical protein
MWNTAGSIYSISYFSIKRDSIQIWNGYSGNYSNTAGGGGAGSMITIDSPYYPPTMPKTPLAFLINFSILYRYKQATAANNN